MPFLLSHSFAGTSVATVPFSRRVPNRVWWLAALCGAVPDFDYAWNVHGWDFRHVSAESWLGHRGLTHTPFFALVFATLMVWLAFRSVDRGTRVRIWIALFLATVSHGLLDGLSLSSPGVPFFFPLSTVRYHLPWRVIRADPHGNGLLAVLLRSIRTELIWIWLPGAILLMLTALRRRLAGRAAVA